MLPSSFDGKDWDELSFEEQVYGPQNIVDEKIGIVRCKKTKEKPARKMADTWTFIHDDVQNTRGLP